MQWYASRLDEDYEEEVNLKFVDLNVNDAQLKRVQAKALLSG